MTLQPPGFCQWLKRRYFFLLGFAKIKRILFALIILRKLMVNVPMKDRLDMIDEICSDCLNNSISFWETQGHKLQMRFRYSGLEQKIKAVPKSQSIFFSWLSLGFSYLWFFLCFLIPFFFFPMRLTFSLPRT